MDGKIVMIYYNIHIAGRFIIPLQIELRIIHEKQNA